MKSRSLAGDTKPGDAASNRLMRLLIGLAVLLTAAAVAIGVDLWLRPENGVPITQSDRSSQSTASASPSAVPSLTAMAPVAATPTPGTPPPCIVPYDWGIHVVQEGDTLFSLAQLYGTDVENLKRVNCLDDPTILVNQRLYVPGPLALPTFATPTPLEPSPLSPTNTPEPELATTETAGVPLEVPTIVVPTPDRSTRPSPAVRVSIPDRYLNIVLLGSDMRPEESVHRRVGTRHSDLWRTDAIIIMSLDVEDNTLRMLNIPRDLWVDIPGHGYGRINSAELWGELAEEGGGPDAVKQTIHNNLGIPIHYYGQADFEGFIHVVDTLGGLDVAVDCPLPARNLEAGIHHMDGVEVLKYMTSRKDYSDFDRGRRQRRVLMALWDQALTPGIIPRLPELWVTMADNFQTDLPLDKVINLAYFGLQLKPRNIHQASINRKHVEDWIAPNGAMVLRPREEELREFLEGFYAPIDHASEERVDRVRVQVLNGSQRFQAEELAADTLRGKGFKVVDRGQAERQDYAHTQIRVFKGDPAAGTWIAERLKVPLTAILDLTTTPDPPDLSNPVDIKVILGADYDPCQP
jgi:LCP family protein required for cell wall assembly